MDGVQVVSHANGGRTRVDIAATAAVLARLAVQRQHDLATTALVAVLAQVDPLPVAQRQRSRTDRYG